MAILNTKKEARRQAEGLSEVYDMKYNDDGTFHIYAKGDDSGTKGRTDLMVDADRVLPSFNRKKRMTTKLFQKMAEAKRLEGVEEGNATMAAELQALKDKLALLNAANTTKNEKKKEVIVDEEIIKPNEIKEKPVEEIPLEYSYKPIEWTPTWLQKEQKEQKIVDSNEVSWNPEYDKNAQVVNWEPTWAKYRKGKVPKEAKDLTTEQWSEIKDSNNPVTHGMLNKALKNKIKFIKYKGKIIDVNKTSEAVQKLRKKFNDNENAPWYAPSLLNYKHLKFGDNDLLPVVIEKRKKQEPSLMDIALSTGSLFKKTGGKLIER